MSAAVIFALVFGFLLGLVFGMWSVWQYMITHERRPLKITVDPRVLSQINGVMIAAWLDQRGLIWMPKGKDFKAGEKLP